MIIDLFIKAVYVVVHPLVDVLPSGSPVLPGAGAVASFIADVDYLIPISAVLQVAIGLLGCVVAFISLRFALVLWQQIKW